MNRVTQQHTGSSAGAGSQEFHIYRNNRKKEMARLEYMKRVGDREVAEAEYAAKIAQREAEFEDRTAKKRSKRCVAYRER
jgi:hypothetical protein